ncbi:hypothetical protein D3C87_2003070 [compost metagenome]
MSIERSGCSRVVMMNFSDSAKCSQPISRVALSNSRWKSINVPNSRCSSTVSAAWVS